MANPVFKRLKDIAAEQQCSRETARRAALAGKLPAFQPFGPGTAWAVRPDYAEFLGKMRKDSADAAEQAAGETVTETI